MPLRVGFDGVRVIFPPSSSTFSFCCFLGVDFGLRLLPRFFLVVLGVALGVAIATLLVSNFSMRSISGAIASAMAALNMSLNSADTAFDITAKCPKAEADF